MIPDAQSRDNEPQPRSRLLQLPCELRDEILRYVVTQSEPMDLIDPEAVLELDLRVMYVCRQLRDEARALLYHENTLAVIVQTKGPVTHVQFSLHDWMTEYSLEKIVDDISSRFLERFARFQFRFADFKQLGSLRRSFDAIKHHFHKRHIQFILPPQKERITTHQALSHRILLYGCITSPLACFSVIRCGSLSITSHAPDYNLIQHHKLIDLVTSSRPVVDMVREYDNAQHLARSLAKMIVPLVASQDFERLKYQLLVHLAAICQSANMSDQDSFLVKQEDFKKCYREIEDLQNM